MQIVEKEFKQIKEDLYSVMTKSKDDRELLKHLYKLNNGNEELQEVIILLYSNFKAEMDLINNHQYINVNKIVDANIKLLERLKVLIEEQNKKSKPINTGFFNKFMELSNTLKGLILIVTAIITLVGLRELFPESVDTIINFIVNLFTTKTMTKI